MVQWQSLCNILLYSLGNSTCLSTLMYFQSSLSHRDVYFHISVYKLSPLSCLSSWETSSSVLLHFCFELAGRRFLLHFFSFFFVFNFFVCCNVFYTSKVRLSIVKRRWENMAWLEQSMGPWEKNTLRITYITVTAGVDKHNFVLGKQNDFLAFSEKNWKCWVD